MKPALYGLVILLGLVQLGLAFGMMRAVDEAIGSGAVRRDGFIGPMPPPVARLDEGAARRLTMLGAGTAVCGAGCVMIGALLSGMYLLQNVARRSRLGTDEPIEA